jgi:hypothetical protein
MADALRTFASRSARLLLVAALSLVAAGCGSDAPYEVISISGTVMYEDETPVPGEYVTVTFIPQVENLDSKTYPRSAQAGVDPDGTFSNASTYEFGDGVIPGEHKVVVESVDANESPTGAVPPEYSSQESTPLTITVSPDETTFDIRLPKPE